MENKTQTKRKELNTGVQIRFICAEMRLCMCFLGTSNVAVSFGKANKF